MAWIYHPGLFVQKIIVDKHLIPSGNKVDVDVIGDLQVAVHSQESGEGSINRIMKRHGIQGNVLFISEKEL